MTIKRQSMRPDNGTVMLVVLVLIAAMTLLILSNTRTLYTLKREIRLIEKKHHQHWTNSPPQQVSTTTR